MVSCSTSVVTVTSGAAASLGAAFALLIAGVPAPWAFGTPGVLAAFAALLLAAGAGGGGVM